MRAHIVLVLLATLHGSLAQRQGANIGRQLQIILRNIAELRQEQGSKHSTLIKETRELDREYGATLESLEDLKDEVQEIKGNINSKLTTLNRDFVTKNDLREEMHKLKQQGQNNENRVMRLIDLVNRNAEYQTQQLDLIRRQIAKSRQTNVAPAVVTRPSVPATKRTPAKPAEEKSTNLPDNAVSRNEPNVEGMTLDTSTVAVTDPTSTEDPEPIIQRISKTELQKMFQFQKFDQRVDVNTWSARRNKKEPNNGAVVYTNAFPLNTVMMFNITLNIKKASAMEMGVCFSKSEPNGSTWRGNTRQAAVWYNKGTFFNKGIKSFSWPTYGTNDEITISYYPNLGRIGFLKNKEFVGEKIFRARPANKEFMFCITMYEPKDQVTVSRYYTVNYASTG